MDYQVLFNIVLGLVSFMGGYILYGIRDGIKALQEDDRALGEKIQNIEILVAGKYVTRDDLQKMGQDIFNVLRRIEDKLDNKADK